MHNVASDDGDSCEVTVRLIVMMVMVVITVFVTLIYADD